MYFLKMKIIKAPEEDIGEFFHNLGEEKNFLTRLKNIEITREKIGNLKENLLKKRLIISNT